MLLREPSDDVIAPISIYSEPVSAIVVLNIPRSIKIAERQSFLQLAEFFEL